MSTAHLVHTQGSCQSLLQPHPHNILAQYPDDELMSLDEYISQMKPTYTAIHTKLAQPKFLQATRDPLLLPPLKLRNPES
jgi:hypothetical protein